MPKQNNKEKQKEVLDKLFTILQINENNKTFSLKELDSNEEKQNKILGLEEEIKEAFCYSTWTCFRRDTKRKWLSMIKYVMKELDEKLISTNKAIKNESGTFDNVLIYSVL